MKRRILASWMVAGLLMGGLATTVLAQNGAGRSGNGRGYGGPPRTQEERAARQAACLERNGGICPNGGPRTNCPAGGYGRGKGQGCGWRHGLRDGTGPRAAQGTCPLTNQAPVRK